MQVSLYYLRPGTASRAPKMRDGPAILRRTFFMLIQLGRFVNRLGTPASIEW